MNLIVNQINIINTYQLSSFPEQKINELISDLNVHYGKINSYIEAKIDQEKINIEVIDSLAKLEEINRLVPYTIQSNSMTSDFRLGVDLLESIIALLNTQSGHESTREKLLNLGWNLLQKLYPFSYEKLKNEALLFNWLKHYNLVKSNGISRWDYQKSKPNDKKLKFSPSEEELEKFYENNREEIYQYMVHAMGPDIEPSDPFRQANAADFYHYHQTLSNVIVHTESAA